MYCSSVDYDFKAWRSSWLLNSRSFASSFYLSSSKWELIWCFRSWFCSRTSLFLDSNLLSWIERSSIFYATEWTRDSKCSWISGMAFLIVWTSWPWCSPWMTHSAQIGWVWQVKQKYETNSSGWLAQGTPPPGIIEGANDDVPPYWEPWVALMWSWFLFWNGDGGLN